MKKVSFFIGSLSGGGSERVCVNIMNSLDGQTEWNARLVTLNNENDVFANDVINRAALVNLNVKNARFAVKPLIKYLKKERIDLAVTFSYELTVLLVIIRKMLRLKFGIISRNVNNFSENINEQTTVWRKYIAIPLIKKMYSQADYYINQCEGMKADLVQCYPKLLNKSCVIYNPIKQSLYQEIRAVNPVINYPFILCIGRLEKQKNFSDAIQAFYRISKEKPALKLVIIGQGSQEYQLKEQVKSLNLESRVIFEGFKNNIVDYYCSAIATMLTSNYEGFPNVLLESVALGTPVISYNCPSGPSEIIIEGVNGYLIEHKNINQMSEAIVKITNANLSSSHVKETAAKYKSDVIVEQYLACMNRINNQMAG